jgi:uncharacterized membrane protein
VLDGLLFISVLVAALGCGLVAGTFFVFSVAIMRALERVSGGMAAMQSINVVILNPAFLGVFMGTALLCVLLAIASLARWSWPASILIFAGALVYLVGSIAVTMIFNVPMNNSLAASDPATAEGHEVWSAYLRNWTFWNHVRSIASLGASAAFMIGATHIR